MTAAARYRSLLGLLLTPVAVGAGALAAWRFGADAGWIRKFFISEGLLSHWQVWCALAMSMEICAYGLSRGAAKREPASPALARVRAAS